MRRALDSTSIWLLRLAFIWAWLICAFLVAFAMNSEQAFYALAGAGFVLLTAASLTVLR
jgi:hypothetical protein